MRKRFEFFLRKLETNITMWMFGFHLENNKYNIYDTVMLDIFLLYLNSAPKMANYGPDKTRNCKKYFFKNYLYKN